MSIVDGIIGAGIATNTKIKNLEENSFSKLDKLRMWAGGFRGLNEVSQMQTPPTVTLRNSTSSILNGSNNGSGIPSNGLVSKLNINGANSYETLTSNPNNIRIKGVNSQSLDGTFPYAPLTRFRFTISNPKFEIVFNEFTGSKINMMVDGKFVNLLDGNYPAFGQSNNTRYLLVDFGDDTLTYGLTGANSVDGGSGYSVGDILTIQGGTFTRPATIRTRGASATNFYVQDPGDYSVRPTGTLTTTGGTGTGATVTPAFWFPKHTTYRPRNVELLVENCDIYGINYTQMSAVSQITPWKFNKMSPTMYWIGDSQDSNTYGIIAGTILGYIASLRLGMGDNIFIDGRGGTGFNSPNANAPAFEHANRINACIAAKPDIVVFPYSQNVGSNTQTTSQAAALHFVNTLQESLPNTLFVMIGPAFGAQSWHNAAIQYVINNSHDPKRLRYIDTIGEGWATDTTSGGGANGFLTSDNVHWGGWGNIHWRSKIVANGIASSIFDMLS